MRDSIEVLWGQVKEKRTKKVERDHFSKEGFRIIVHLGKMDIFLKYAVFNFFLCRESYLEAILKETKFLKYSA